LETSVLVMVSTLLTTSMTAVLAQTTMAAQTMAAQTMAAQTMAVVLV
jgi:hypothetical protein